MTVARSTEGRRRPRVVGVIMSRADLDLAICMGKPPDLFELRLDHLADIVDELEKKLSRLRKPLIITARHPHEGGANKLSVRQRRDLLSRFLPHARYIDIELRSAVAIYSLLNVARKENVRRIVSFHDLKGTPDLGRLQARARRAKSLGADIFKVATRTDTPAQLARLLEFATKKEPPLSGAERRRTDVGLAVSAMGIGKLGRISRVLLAYRGSALVYGSVAEASDIEGQMSLEQLRAFGIGTSNRIRIAGAVPGKKMTERQ
jgi:3-dehydroquinate dehydratase I